MADTGDDIFSNLPRRRKRAVEDDDARSFFRERRGVYMPEGPLPPRPHASGKGGPSLTASNAPPVLSASPTIAGSPAVGQTLSCSQGVWFNSPTSYTYQWLRDGTVISGATSSTYVVVSGDLGHSISCTVTATNAHGSTPATSNAVVIVALPANTAAPVASGSLTVGSTLSCTQGTWSNSPTSYAYQWQRGGTNISGATSSTYVTVTADGGTSVGCVVTATNASGSASQASNTLAIASGSGHSAQALAYLARTVGGNEGGNGTNIANLIDGLVSDGVWAKLDALYVLAQQNATDALLNLIGTSYTASNPDAVPFTAYQGYGPFASVNGYLITNFNATTATSPQFTQNFASFGFWSYADVLEIYPEMGNGFVEAGASLIYGDYSGNLFYARVNDSSAGSVSNPGTKGLYAGDRSSSTAVVPYWDGASQGSVASTSAVSPNNFFFIGSSPGSAQPSGSTLSAAFIGASLGSAGQLALYNRLQTYMTAVAPPSTSVWSAADAAANGMTLSNGGLTLSVPVYSGGAFKIARSTVSKTAGKLYLEFLLVVGAGTYQQIGVASSGVNIANYLGASNYSFGEDPSFGSLFFSAGFSGPSSSTLNVTEAVNDIFMIAVDFTANQFAIGRNNVWADGASPGAGVYTWSFVPGTVGALFAAMAFDGSSAQTWTLQPTAASQKYTPPAGFTPWG